MIAFVHFTLQKLQRQKEPQTNTELYLIIHMLKWGRGKVTYFEMHPKDKMDLWMARGMDRWIDV